MKREYIPFSETSNYLEDSSEGEATRIRRRSSFELTG